MAIHTYVGWCRDLLHMFIVVYWTLTWSKRVTATWPEIRRHNPTCAAVTVRSLTMMLVLDLMATESNRRHDCCKNFAWELWWIKVILISTGMQLLLDGDTILSWYIFQQYSWRCSHTNGPTITPLDKYSNSTVEGVPIAMDQQWLLLVNINTAQ